MSDRTKNIIWVAILAALGIYLYKNREKINWGKLITTLVVLFIGFWVFVIVGACLLRIGM